MLGFSEKDVFAYEPEAAKEAERGHVDWSAMRARRSAPQSVKAAN
jgi:hypothetical protein